MRWKSSGSLAESAVNLNRSTGTDRLSQAVKVSAPVPVVPEHFNEGLSTITVRALEHVIQSQDGTLPSTTYHRLVTAGSVTPDPRQLAALATLDALFEKLKVREPPAAAAKPAAGLFGRLMEEGIKLPSLEHDFGDQRWKLTWKPRVKATAGIATVVDVAVPNQQGIYLHGGVGCGKTFLMDMFFHALPLDRKRRVHFHSFMMDVHLRVHNRRKRLGSEADPLPGIAEELIGDAWVLCFDEFQVTDVVDAMMMARLFAEYFKRGGVMVATSNRDPDGLYENGLQRRLFTPFIKTVKEQTVVHDMSSTTDYRLTGEHKDNVFMHPADAHNAIRADNIFRMLAKGEPPAQTTFRHRGRTLLVREGCVNQKVARFRFSELCEQPYGAADFQVVGRNFHTVFITDIPVLDTGGRLNATRRFITLIDTLYEMHVKLICTAACAPADLLDGSQYRKQEADLLGNADYIQDNQDEAFAFDRTVSRLTEMQTEQYLKEAHRADNDDDDHHHHHHHHHHDA